MNGLEQALQYTSSSVWQYARISSDPAVTGDQNPGTLYLFSLLPYFYKPYMQFYSYMRVLPYILNRF